MLIINFSLHVTNMNASYKQIFCLRYSKYTSICDYFTLVVLDSEDSLAWQLPWKTGDNLMDIERGTFPSIRKCDDICDTSEVPTSSTFTQNCSKSKKTWTGPSSFGRQISKHKI